jgi:transcriptional regulator with XRE-family HTH domain
MNIKQVVGDNIRFLRQKRNMTLDYLSVRAKMSRTFISDIERGVKTPSIVSLEKIAKVLKVTPAQLLIPNFYKEIT